MTGENQGRDQVQLVCEHCGAVTDGSSTPTDAISQRVASSFSFLATAVQVTVFGSCAHCRPRDEG